MGLFSFLFGRKPDAKLQKPEATQKRYPNRNAKRKVYPIFADDYYGGDEWQWIEIERENPDGFMPVKRGNKLNVKGLNIDNRAEPFFIALNARTAELEVRPAPDNPTDPNALAVFGIPCSGHQAVFLGYVPKEISASIAQEFTSELPLKARLCAVAQKGNGQAVIVRFALLYPKAAGRKPFLKNT